MKVVQYGFKKILYQSLVMRCQNQVLLFFSFLTLCGAHGKHLSLSFVEHINHSGTEVIWHSHIDLTKQIEIQILYNAPLCAHKLKIYVIRKETYLLERLAFNTVDHSIDDSRGADHELETLSAHVLNEHGKMELTTTAHCTEK